MEAERLELEAKLEALQAEVEALKNEKEALEAGSNPQNVTAQITTLLNTIVELVFLESFVQALPVLTIVPPVVPL